MTTPQHALEGLRRALVSGQLRPAARIPQEEVAVQLGVGVATVREALTVLEQEGQVTYRPRRGYFVTELRLSDLEEIYELRELLETRAVRLSLPLKDDLDHERMRLAAAACANAAEEADIAAELSANRRFHFAILEAPGQPHLMRLIRQLWDKTETYRALYYNAASERQHALEAHDRIMDAVLSNDLAALTVCLDDHRRHALEVLRPVLGA